MPSSKKIDLTAADVSEKQSVMLVFSTQHFKVLPLSPFLWFKSPPPFPVYTVYTYILCKGGGMGFWASDRQTPVAKSLHRSIVLDDDILHCLL